MAKISAIENVLKFEKIAYNASWCNFIFANFAKKSFSTDTGFVDSYPDAVLQTVREVSSVFSSHPYVF